VAMQDQLQALFSAFRTLVSRQRKHCSSSVTYDYSHAQYATHLHETSRKSENSVSRYWAKT